ERAVSGASAPFRRPQPPRRRAAAGLTKGLKALVSNCRMVVDNVGEDNPAADLPRLRPNGAAACRGRSCMTQRQPTSGLRSLGRVSGRLVPAVAGAGSGSAQGPPPAPQLTAGPRASQAGFL